MAAIDDEAPDELDGSQAPPSSERSGFASKMLGDLAKRALTTGIGAVFMSEDALRGSLAEMKLPKEAMGYVVAQADKTKKEIVAAIARETRHFLSKLEMEKVLARVLSGTTIEIQTRIRLLPKADGGLGVEVTDNVSHVRSTEDAPPSADLPSDADRPKRRRRRRGEADDD